MRRPHPLAGLLLSLLPLAAVPGRDDADALPMFSRASSVACARCHTAAPRLTAYGMEFLQAGFQPRDSSLATMWSAHGPAVSLDASSSYSIAKEDIRRPSVPGAQREAQGKGAWGELAIHAAGTVRRNVSVRYGGAYDAATRVFATEQAYVQSDDVARSGALNVRAGRFEVEAPYLSDSRRPTAKPYLSPVSLDAEGLELNGERSAWTWAVGRAESRRRASGDDPAERFLGGFEDTYLAIMRGTGTERIAGRMLFDHQASNLREHAWLQHLQAVGSALLTAGPLTLVPAYVFDRFDDRPEAGMHERHQYGLIEVSCVLGTRRRWDIAARGEHEYVTANALTREMDRNLEVLSLGYSSHPGLRLEVEGSNAGNNVGGPAVRRVGLSVRVGV